MTNLIQRRLAGRPLSTRDQRGMGLLDVLLGMAIFALVITIGAQNFNTMRERSYVTRAVADVKQVATGIDTIRSKDDAYPTTVARNASNLPGINLTAGSRITGYWSSDASFRVCLSQNSGSSAKAWAMYESVRGTITGSGKGGGPAECDGVTGIDNTTPEPVDPNTPVNVRATAEPGQPSAVIEWDAVTGATAYAVYLDDATSPAWTGPGTTTTLPGLSLGEHNVRVTATVGGTASPKSEPARFTITGDNDYIANAHPIPDRPDSQWFSRDYSTAGTSAAEPGEVTGQDYYSRWWTFTAPRDAHYYVEVVGPADGSGLGTWYYPETYVWKTSATSTAGGLGATVVDSGAISPNRVWFDAREGESFKIRVSTGGSNHDNRRYRLMVATGPLNDYAAAAATIPGHIEPLGNWRSEDVRPQYAFTEPGEDPSAVSNTMWWNFTPTATGTYLFNIIGSSTGSTPYVHHMFYVWETSPTTPVASLGTPYAQKTSSYRTTEGVTFTGIAGRTYRLRVSGNTPIQMRVQMSRGPLNDFLATAADVPDIAPGDSWTSADVDNTRAGAEPYEPTDNGYSMWWTYTPTRSGTVRVEVLAPTDGANYVRYRRLYAYRTTTGDVTATGGAIANAGYTGDYDPVINFPVVAGLTYKVKMSTTGAGQFGRYRMKFTHS
jgi:type II secretory pathway pseudopilin PulG